MKEKIKEFLFRNWRSIAFLIGGAFLLFISGCGSTWRISDNKVGVVVMKNDTINGTIKCRHDSIP